MAIKIWDETIPLNVGALQLADLIVRRVDEVGDLLDACHELLLSVFDESVVDPKPVYVDALTDKSQTFRDFRPIFLAAIFRQGGDDLVAGFISSDLMLVGDGAATTNLAIGNIATAKRLQGRFRGVGSTLWNATVEIAQREAKAAGRKVDVSTSEAESDSLPFWKKLGYLWPKDVVYYQPPLDFNDDGSPASAEVKENFLVHPLGGGAKSIAASDLADLVKSIYWNWNLRPWIRKLDAAGRSRATDYVMGTVFPMTMASIPGTGALPLVDVSESPTYKELMRQREHDGAPSRTS